MKKIIVTTLMLIFTISISAQTRRKSDPALCYREIGFTAGIHMNNTASDLSNGTQYNLDYSYYGFDNVGYRLGVSFIEEVGRDISVASVPLKAIYRLPLVSSSIEERAYYAAKGFAHSQSPSTIVTALLEFDFEIFAGFSPGYVIGDGMPPMYDSPTTSSSYDGGGYGVARSFYTSADAGVRVSLRIWRVRLITDVQYSYLLTNNFSNSSKLPSRSYLGVRFGASYMF